MRPAKPLPELKVEDMQRIFARVTVDADGCWTLGNRKNQAYGVYKKNRQSYPAHRVVYAAVKGPIPDGHVVDHICENKCCVNPAHLQVVTQIENIRLANQRRSKKQHSKCVNGHPKVFPNTFSGPAGLSCVACKLQRIAAQKKTHCSNGHPWGPGTYYEYQYKSGVHRRCKKCSADRYLLVKSGAIQPVSKGRKKATKPKNKKVRKPSQRPFWAYVRIVPDGCWEWQGALNKGYGMYGKMRAHRVAYMLCNGLSIQPGMVIDHVCTNRKCVNPDHLEQVTLAENNRRSHANGINYRTGPQQWRGPKNHNNKWKGTANRQAVEQAQAEGYITKRQARDRFGLSRQQVNKFAENTHLAHTPKGKMVGGVWMYRPEDIEHWMSVKETRASRRSGTRRKVKVSSRQMSLMGSD